MNRYIKITVWFFIIIFFFAFSYSSHGKKGEIIYFSSGEKKNTLIELFTSQGCSSCPPGEKWLSRLHDDPRLWKSIFPLAFHVTYWDHLGWKDKFSAESFTARQRNYRKDNIIGVLYTPCFIVNGREWRGWYSGKKIPTSKNKSMILKGNLTKQRLRVYSSADSHPHYLNIAIVAISQKNYIKRGENAQRNLHENFIVLKYKKYFSKNGKWSIYLNRSQYNNQKYAVVLWVSTVKKQTPLQVTGFTF